MHRFLILFTFLVITACGGQTKEELLQEGNRLRDEGNFRGAVVLYKNALEKDANFIDARVGLADAYLSSGSLDRAEKEFQKAQLQNPSLTDIQLKLATVYIQKNLPLEALLELDKFHSSNPESSKSLLLNGRAHGASGDLASAENLFKKALSLDPQSIPAKFNLAKVYLQKENYSRTKEYLQEIIAQDDNYSAAYYLLATVEARSGKPDAALSTYQALVKVKSKELHALYMVGLLLMEKGDMAAAEAAIESLSTQFPDRPEGSRLKGLLLYRQNNFDDAILELSKSLKTQQHLLSYFFLGLNYYSLKRFELALNQFQKALDLNPDFERARILVAMTLFKQKRLDDAAIEIQKVLRKNPNNAYARNILGSIYLADGQYDEGMIELELATELDPTLADAHLKRGLFHLAKGEGAQGEADLIKAVDVAPEILNSRLMLVTHYLRQKNYSSAIESLKAGMDGSPSDALLNNYLAAAYFSQKKSEKALAALQQAKKINPAYLTPYFNLASYYASQSEYESATAEYLSVVEQDKKNIKALLGLAALYSVQGKNADVESIYQQLESTGLEQGYLAAASYQIKQKNPQAALAIIDKGLAQHNGSQGLLEAKGGLHLQIKQVDEAESTFTRLSGINAERGNQLLLGVYLKTKQLEKAQTLVDGLLKAEPGKDYPYLLSAGLFVSQKKLAAASEQLQKGIGAVSDPLRLQMQLARVFEATDKTSQAEQVYQRILKKTSRFAPAYTSLGFIKERQGDKGAALELYRNALKYDSKDVSALNNAAYLLTDNFGQEKEALDLAMSAYRLRPSDPRIMDTLGYILLKNKRPADAINLLEKSHDLLPDIATIKLHLALAKIELNQASEARELLQQVVENGDKAEVSQAKKLLKTL